MASRVWTFLLCAVISSLVSICAADEYVVTLEHSNFSETVSKSDFIVVEFYAPWCGHCKNLAPEYEKAASTLSSHDPPITLAKVDATVEANQELISTFQIRGFPTLKILRNGGKGVQEYKGPREADGIVAYLKKQLGPATTEIKSAEDAASFVDEKKIFIVGIFPEFSGEEYLNYTILAEKLRSDYDFAHTLDAKLLPRGESVKKPTFRLFKPFDELLVDSQDFDLNALEKFIEDASVPILTVFTNDPNSHPFVMKYFNSPNAKAMLFVNFSSENLDAFKSKLHGVASLYKGKGILFLLGDLEAGKGAFEHFGLQNEQAPLIIAVSADNHQKYLKANLQPDDIAPWVEDYINGKVAQFTRSEPIPEINNEPVKVVVADSIQDIVFKSGKNVLVEFYAPWCGHCKQLAPILDEVVVSFEKDDNVIIAKMDATKNDVPSDTFQVEGYPTCILSLLVVNWYRMKGLEQRRLLLNLSIKTVMGMSLKKKKKKKNHR